MQHTNYFKLDCVSILVSLLNAKQKQSCPIREKIEPYVVETVSIWEETRIKFSSASGKYLGTILSITCLRSEYKSVFPLKRPPAIQFAPISVWNSSSWTSTSQWAVFFIFSATAYTYYCMGMSKWIVQLKGNVPENVKSQQQYITG